MRNDEAKIGDWSKEPYLSGNHGRIADQGNVKDMITAGIDCGAKTTKTVVVKDGEIVGKGSVLTGFDPGKAVEKSLNQALVAAGLSRDDIEKIGATGSGKASIKMARLLMVPLLLMLCSCAALYQPPKLHEGGGIKVIYEDQIRDWQERVKKEKWSENFVDEIVRTCRLLVKYTANKNPDYRWKNNYWFTPPSHLLNLRNLRIKSAPVRVRLWQT